MKEKIRKFKSGATRDTEEGKIDPEGFLSPLVIHAYCKYLQKHRVQSDGTLRDSDNWQKGISRNVYMKSIWRHQMDVWAIHRGYSVYKERTDKGEITHILPTRPENKNPNWTPVTLEDALGGLIFNSMGYWHEFLKLKVVNVEAGKCAENEKQYLIRNPSFAELNLTQKSKNILAEHGKDIALAGMFDIVQWEEIVNFLEEFREK